MHEIQPGSNDALGDAWLREKHHCCMSNRSFSNKLNRLNQCSSLRPSSVLRWTAVPRIATSSVVTPMSRIIGCQGFRYSNIHHQRRAAGDVDNLIILSSFQFDLNVVFLVTCCTILDKICCMYVSSDWLRAIDDIHIIINAGICQYKSSIDLCEIS